MSESTDTSVTASDGTRQTLEVETVYFPPRRRDLRRIDADIELVTVLEDRAQVRRRGAIVLEEGQQRLYVEDIAPVVYDVSARAVVTRGEARVADVVVERAMRVRRRERPEAARAVEELIRELQRRATVLEESRERDEARARAIRHMLECAAEEIPIDAAWGRVDTEAWREGFERLFDQSRRLEHQWYERRWELEDIARDLQNAIKRRRTMWRPDQEFVAWLEIDVLVEHGGVIELDIEYVVPNALWRPLHTARLVDADGQDARLVVTSQAAVWQHTGEDWRNVPLVCSTAQSSLGVEPPALGDDLLSATRRSDQIVVAQREVEVQRTGPSGGTGGAAPAQPRGVDLPGVDDGGEVRNLRSPDPVTVPSDGKPVFVPLFRSSSPADVELVLLPELDERVFLRVTARNEAAWPMLAGPVELMRDSGTVGWTKTLFVAPGARFELGFGPLHDVRVKRYAQLVHDAVDSVDQWHRRRTLVSIYVSNLTDAPRSVTVTERIPVSEIEHVRIELLDEVTITHSDHTVRTDRWTLDDDGLCRLEVELEPYARRILTLGWSQATAPGVQMR